MKYWDPSAIVPLILPRPDLRGRNALFEEDSETMSWWASRVECASALFRLRREEAVDERGLAQALGKLDAFLETCVEIEGPPVESRPLTPCADRVSR